MGLMPFDKNLELRDVATGAVTATGNTTAVVFDVAHAGSFDVNIYVTAIDGTSGDETYTIAVAADDAASSGFVTLGQVAIARTITPSQTFQVTLHSQTAVKLKPAANKLRLTHTLAGTTPSITYGAFVTKVASGGLGTSADLA